MIYFMRRTDGVIKIGCSANPEIRKGQVQSDWGCNLELLAAVPGGRAEEKEMHERFKAYRQNPRHEWFEPADELINHIEQAASEHPLKPEEWPVRKRNNLLMVHLNTDEMAKLDRLVAKMRRQSGIRFGRASVIRWLIHNA